VSPVTCAVARRGVPQQVQVPFVMLTVLPSSRVSKTPASSSEPNATPTPTGSP